MTGPGTRRKAASSVHSASSNPRLPSYGKRFGMRSIASGYSNREGVLPHHLVAGVQSDLIACEVDESRMAAGRQKLTKP
jgi:hypothetical protein